MGLIKRNLGLGRKRTSEEQAEFDRKFQEKLRIAREEYKGYGVFSLDDPTGEDFREMIENIKKDPGYITEWNGSIEDYEKFIDDVRSGKYDI